MAKQIRVRTPQTEDGNVLRYDEAGKVVYKETIHPAGARKQFESINANLPKHLKRTIEDVSDAPAAPARTSGVANSDLDDEAKADKEAKAAAAKAEKEGSQQSE